MLDLISKIIFDLRKNFKPFIIIYIFFISLFFLNDIHKSKVLMKAFDIVIEGENHTLGHLLQSHINKLFKEKTYFFCFDVPISCIFCKLQQN